MSLLVRKFPASAFMFNEDLAYVKTTELQRFHKDTFKKRSITQVEFKNKLGVNDCIVAWHRHKDGTKIGSIASRIIDGFKSQTQILYLSVNEVEHPKDGPNKQFHEDLLRAINNKPDILEPTDEKPSASMVTRDDTSIEEKPAASIVSNHGDRIEMPIIKLQEHEHFRDVDGTVFPIEIRGQRTRDGMFFKAKDLAAFGDKDNLIKVMFDEHKSYQLGIDYIIAEEFQEHYWCHSDSPIIPNSSTRSGGVNHDLVYLTTTGLIRLVAVSRNPNANIAKIFEWLVNLFYVHQFGSYEERNELAQSLFKQVLNDELSGLYFIDIDKLDNLYDTMGISRETYPPKQYGGYRIGKFGLSNNMKDRLAQHKNKKNGYGKYSKEVNLKWTILLSPSQLSKAEDILANLLKANGFAFEYDGSDKTHKELIMFDPNKEHRLKNIYRQVMGVFPSRENELAKTLEDAQATFENKLKMIQMEAVHRVAMIETTTAQRICDIQHEMALLKASMVQQELQHKINMLEMENKMLHGSN